MAPSCLRVFGRDEQLSERLTRLGLARRTASLVLPLPGRMPHGAIAKPNGRWVVRTVKVAAPYVPPRPDLPPPVREPSKHRRSVVIAILAGAIGSLLLFSAIGSLNMSSTRSGITEGPAPGEGPSSSAGDTGNHTPATPRLVSTPEDVLKTCLSVNLVDAACPRRVPLVDGTYSVRAWSTAAGSETGAGWETLDVSYGHPYLGIRRKNAPPEFAHLVIRAGDLSHAFPFTFPGRDEPAQTITKRPARYRENVIPLGAYDWGGKAGVLILSPPSSGTRSPGDHLVFRWRDGGVDYEISLHAWVPLDLARSMLGSIVKSIG